VTILINDIPIDLWPIVCLIAMVVLTAYALGRYGRPKAERAYPSTPRRVSWEDVTGAPLPDFGERDIGRGDGRLRLSREEADRVFAALDGGDE
jgi:hypothetical protein